MCRSSYKAFIIHKSIEERFTLFYEEDNRLQIDIDAAVSILWQSYITLTVYTMYLHDSYLYVPFVQLGRLRLYERIFQTGLILSHCKINSQPKVLFKFQWLVCQAYQFALQRYNFSRCFRWVGNRTRTSGSVSTPPLPSLTSSNASDSRVQSPSHRNNTIPRYSSREVSSSGNASVVTSLAGTGDEANIGRDRSHSWHELPSDVECQIQRRSSRNISLLRHNPRTGNTETIVIETHPNGDSGTSK